MQKMALTQIPRSFQQGLTLIEVLVSVIILSIGILGMLAMQTTGLKSNQSSFHRTQAVIVAYDIIDRMRANPTGVSEGFYNSINTNNSGGEPNCSGGCAPQERANWDAAQWAKNFDDDSNIFPDGLGTVDANGDGTFNVTVQWQEVDWDNEKAGAKTLEDKSITVVARPNFE